jgi:creatinine amidohydrolase
MRRIIVLLSACTLAAAASQSASQRPAAPTSQWLERITWYDAADSLKPESVVLIPVGAAAKEHGPHLKLSNDAILADYLTRRVAEATSVVVAPPLAYHFYPAFLEYPGSTSLALSTARDLTSDVVRSLARYGPRRFYILNTGISTVRPLAASAQALASEGILVRYTNLETALEPTARGLRQQEGGTHADEIETSIMLYIDPQSVDMSKAVKDYDPRSTPFGLTRQKGGQGTYSPTGIWGDPTLATRQKGRVLTEALVTAIVQEIDALRKTAPPDGKLTEAAAPAAPRPAPPAADRSAAPERCSAGDERTIRAFGDGFTRHWANADADQLAELWAELGDIAHPDGTVERTRQVILQNRRELFRRREYRHSRHPMQIGPIRCLTNDIAVADGKWELRDVTDPAGKPVPTRKGLVTLVMKRSGGWRIEAYRYTIDAPESAGPTLLKRPGWPGRGGGPS